MKTTIAYSCLIWSVLAITGCSFDPGYEAEKAFWEADQLGRSLAAAHPDGLEEKQYLELIRAFGQVVEVAPAETLAAEAQFRIAQMYITIGNLESAHTTLNSIFKEFQEDKEIAARAAFSNGKLYQANGEIEPAMRQYQAIMQNCPLTSIGLEMPIYIILYYQQQGDQDRTRSASSQARKHYQNLMNAYAGTSVAKKVRPYLLRVFELENAWADMLDFWTAEIKKQINRTDIIEANLGKASVLATRLDQPAEAKEIYESLIARFPTEPMTALVRVRLAYLEVADSNWDKARQYFSRAWQDLPADNPLRINSYLGLAMIERKQKNDRAAFDYYDRIQAEFPNNSTALQVPLIKYLHHQNVNQPAKAEEALQAAIETYRSQWLDKPSADTAPIVGQLLLQCLIQQKDWSAAATHLEVLTKRFPEEARYNKLFTALQTIDPSDLGRALQDFSNNPQSMPAMQPPR